MDANELAYRERYAPTLVLVAPPERTALPAVLAGVDPTDGLPIFVNVGSPTTDEALERMFAQENGG